MADLSITISNSLAVLGPGPASLYGVAQFGVDVWGAQEDLFTQVEKWLPAETITLTGSVAFSFQKTISNTLSVSSAIDLVSLLSGNGYSYVLTGGVTDPSNRYFPAYTAADASTTYSSVAAASTTWGAA